MTWLIRYSALLLVGAIIALYWPELGIPIFLVFMGGALAYVGDQLGIYWGKKRISIFGLRPKQTAVFISVVTGLLITLLTLMVASYLSENVKIALFQIDTLINTQDELRNDQRQILKKNKSLVEKNKTIQAANELLHEEKANLEEARANLLKEKGELEKKIVEVEESLLQLKEDKLRKIGEIERLSRVVEKKETALVAIHKGQPLIETPIIVKLNAKRNEISNLALSMLMDLKQAVESKGVSIDTEKFLHAEEELTTSILKKLEKISEACKKEGTVVSECCIQPVSLRNVSIDEKLQSVNFQVKPNLLIFGKEEEVARTSIDGRLAEERILDQLFYFDKQVISVMREKGVSPNSLRIRMRKISSRQLVKFYEIVRRVRELGRPVLVRLVTLSPIYSYGEINVSYLVEELPGPWTPKGRELGRTTVASIEETHRTTVPVQTSIPMTMTPTPTTNTSALPTSIPTPPVLALPQPVTTTSVEPYPPSTNEIIYDEPVSLPAFVTTAPADYMPLTPEEEKVEAPGVDSGN